RDLKVDAAGNLYYLAGNGGVINKISYISHTNQPPTLAPIADQTVPAGGSVTVTLQGTDPDGDSLTYSAQAETLPYWLDQTYGLYQDSHGYYTNARGQGEKYLRGTASSQNYQ